MMLAERTHHPAWMMLAKSAAKRLDSDARLCCEDIMANQADQLDEQMVKTLGGATWSKHRQPGMEVHETALPARKHGTERPKRITDADDTEEFFEHRPLTEARQ